MNIKILFFIITTLLFGDIVKMESIQVYTIGDSTMANKKTSAFPENGWGQVLNQFFDDNVEIHNHALNGRSSKSFIDEGHWQLVLDSLKKGDYVFIQFGHNDEKEYDTTRYTLPFGSYTSNLKRYVSESRDKGAIPILFTSIVRRKFDKNGTLLDTHGDYIVAVHNLASEMNVPLVDLEKLTRRFIQSIGPEKAKEYYLWIEPNNEYPEGRQDDTHLKIKGAREVASMATRELSKLPLELASHVVPRRPVVGLDNFFNHETDKSGKIYHYTWSDTLNSGFSQLGDIFKEKGTILKTVTQSPLNAVIGDLDVYIVVDPDTTSENPQPNYITADDIRSIENWVKNGGVLLLLANDGPNCEFTHLNQLAGTFGFHFVPTTLNPVTNHQWEMGAEANLPNHPLFEGVNKIYLKEVSPILVSKNAKVVLKDGDDILMAEVIYGKGRIFAIGDPWLYNEYIGNRRLPDSFENMKAAYNLVDYLIKDSKQ